MISHETSVIPWRFCVFVRNVFMWQLSIASYCTPMCGINVAQPDECSRAPWSSRTTLKSSNVVVGNKLLGCTKKHFVLPPSEFDPSDWAVWGESLRRIACCDCGFESRRKFGCRVVCCQRSLRPADLSSRGVLPTVAYHCVWSRNLKNEAALARVRLLRHEWGGRGVRFGLWHFVFW